MAAKDRQRRQNGGRTTRSGRRRLRWRTWHHDSRYPNNEARAWEEAARRLDRERRRGEAG